MIPGIRMPVSRTSACIIGGIWFIIGFPIWISGAKEIKKNFEEGKLITSGIFKYIQHPIYCAWGLFYIPAIVLMTRSWIGFVIPVVFYLSFVYRISFEEKYLSDKFGEKYLFYKNSTGRIFPKL
jgi:protein-S-isoprenylcysteine O-methyltransferase Ste14